jgi:tetratricopeptide (TPR) repeat protein
LEKQPENWKARQALALTFESQGEMVSAAALIKSLPTNLDSESLWNAGRILVQTPSAQEETAHEVGVETLEMAREGGFDDNAIDYWIAHGLRRQDLNEEAIDHYQAFLDNSEDLPSEEHLQGVLGLADAAIAMDDATLAIATMEKHRGQYPTSLEISKCSYFSRKHICLSMTSVLQRTSLARLSSATRLKQMHSPYYASLRKRMAR